MLSLSTIMTITWTVTLARVSTPTIIDSDSSLSLVDCDFSYWPFQNLTAPSDVRDLGLLPFGAPLCPLIRCRFSLCCCFRHPLWGCLLSFPRFVPCFLKFLLFENMQSLLIPIIILDDFFSLRLADRRATARTTNFVERCSFQQKKKIQHCPWCVQAMDSLQRPSCCCVAWYTRWGSLAPRVVALVSSVSQMSGVYSNYRWIVFYSGDWFSFNRARRLLWHTDTAFGWPERGLTLRSGFSWAPAEVREPFETFFCSVLLG